MEWEEYLIKKKIDRAAFEAQEAELYQQFCQLFNQMHPDSFTAQKLYLINDLRRRFPILIENLNS